MNSRIPFFLFPSLLFFFNLIPVPRNMYIVQMLFLMSDDVCEISKLTGLLEYTVFFFFNVVLEIAVHK